MHEIDSIITRYIQGIATADEERTLEEWLHESPENKKRLFSEKDIWDSYACRADLKNYQADIELGLLKSRLSETTPSRKLNLFRALQVAAVLLVVFGLGWASRYYMGISKKPVEISDKVICVPKGQVNQVFLADGTRIWVNSQSKVTLPSVFASNERVVKLSGEAFFEVARDANRPFRVEVKGQQIEVLGTSFNVRAYPNQKEIQTTLSSGKVQLVAGNQRATLEPGEQSSFNQETNQLVIHKVNPINFNSWKEGRFEFQNEDLVEVFKVVERWYDVEIKYKEKDFKGMRFSGVIKRNKDVQHFLNLLNHSIPIQYKNDLDVVTIVPK